MQSTPRVLFLSRGTSIRGQMAAAMLKAFGGPFFEIECAGIDGTELHPLADQVMREIGIDISGYEPKNLGEIVRERFGYVITLYDASRERSPIFPFTPHLLCWSVADPAIPDASVFGNGTDRYRRVRDELRAKIEDFLGQVPRGHEAEPLPHAA